MNQHRSNAPIAAIIAIICILMAGGSIFGIWQFMKNKNEKNDNIKANDMYETSTETTSAKEGTITTSSDTSQEAIPSEEQIMQAVQKAMYAHLDAEFNKEKTDDYYYFDRDVKYALYDINADGIDELFISYQNVESTGSDLYIYKNG